MTLCEDTLIYYMSGATILTKNRNGTLGHGDVF